MGAGLGAGAERAARSSWEQRILRARTLATRRPHARELLRFYEALLRGQASWYDRVRDADWLESVRLADTGEPPRLRPAHMELPDLAIEFRRFLGDVIPESTEALATAAESLLAAGDVVAGGLVTQFLSGGNGGDLPPGLDCEPAHVEFFARAFSQPLMEAVVERFGGPVDPWNGGTCPQCGSQPQVAVIRDDEDVRGRRHLVCSLCAAVWSFPRSTCVSCGESDSEKLMYHVADSLPHIRIEVCQTCQVYVKTVDLRKDGTAVPVVDEIASVELDVWCDERGLRKIQPNALGL